MVEDRQKNVQENQQDWWTYEFAHVVGWIVWVLFTLATLLLVALLATWLEKYELANLPLFYVLSILIILVILLFNWVSPTVGIHKSNFHKRETIQNENFCHALRWQRCIRRPL